MVLVARPEPDHYIRPVTRVDRDGIHHCQGRESRIPIRASGTCIRMYWTGRSGLPSAVHAGCLHDVTICRKQATTEPCLFTFLAAVSSRPSHSILSRDEQTLPRPFRVFVWLGRHCSERPLREQSKADGRQCMLQGYRQVKPSPMHPPTTRGERYLATSCHLHCSTQFEEDTHAHI